MRQAVRAFALATLLALSCSFSDAFAAQVPVELQPPADEHELLRVRAQGDQIYTCAPNGAQFSWTLKAPDAQLYDKDGKPFGRHFAGPSWKSDDGSQITGKAAATTPSPDANSIPWLLVKVVSRSGEGVMAQVTSIERINTKGGKAPASGCDSSHAGQERRVAYSADYVFFVPK
jgi:hypothetical protein